MFTVLVNMRTPDMIILCVCVCVFSLLNNYMMWTLVQKSVASLDQRFENAQDKLLESLLGTKKVGYVTVTAHVMLRVINVCVHVAVSANENKILLQRPFVFLTEVESVLCHRDTQN